MRYAINQEDMPAVRRAHTLSSFTLGHPGLLTPIGRRVAGRRVWDAYTQWLVLRRETQPEWVGRHQPPGLIDVHKSSLLGRLLAGKGAFTTAPPTAYGYPWYDVIDNGYADLADENVDEQGEEVHICQYRYARTGEAPNGDRLLSDGHGREYRLTHMAQTTEGYGVDEWRQLGGCATSGPAVWKLTLLSDV